MQFNITYVYPPDKVRPVVNAVVARNPAACEAEINVGRCRAFSITPKSKRICFFLRNFQRMISTNQMDWLQLV